MEAPLAITGKVIAYEPNPAIAADIKTLSETVGFKCVILDHEDPFILEISGKLNIGLIVLNSDCENFHQLVLHVNAMLPEIPLLIQSVDEDADHQLGQLPNPLAKIHYYQTGDTRALRSLIKMLLFSRQYPPQFIDRVIEITQQAFTTNLRDVNIATSRVFVASDKRIFGGRLEMMPFCTPWCEGMMMIQSNSADLDRLVRAGCTVFQVSQGEVSRYTEDILREIMNQVWGGFKSSFVPAGFSRATEIEVPITINHDEKYVSFGATDPLLCFRVNVEDSKGEKPRFAPLAIYLKFSFHLSWRGEGFQVQEPTHDRGLSEIELF